MALEKIGQALDDHTMALLGPDLAWPGVSFEPDGRPYVAVAMAGYTRRPMSVGRDAVFLHEGTYRLSVFHPSGEGVYAARRKADEIVAHFPRGLTLPGNGPTIEAATVMPDVSQPNWVMIPVQIKWFLQELSS